MRILITGATGLLGSDLLRLLKGGQQVRGWARHAAEGIDPVDITDAGAVRAAMAAWLPHAVVHCAAMSDVDACELNPEQAMSVNATGTENVAAACAKTGAALVSISTDYVFDGTGSRPYREEDPVNPVSLYAKSKLEGERRALALSPKCVSVRVSGIFGPARANFVSGAAARFREGKPVPVVAEQRYSPSFSIDLAAGLALVVEKAGSDPDSCAPGGALHGPLHLANTGEATRLSVAQWVAEVIGAKNPQIERTSWKALNRPARRPDNSQLDTSKFDRFFGKPLRPWREAVKAFLA